MTNYKFNILYIETISFADYQKFLADHCIQHKYMFQIRKCESVTCCRPKRCTTDLPSLPDPILSANKEHFKSFDEVVGQQTTDADRPSALNTTAGAVAECLQVFCLIY